MPQCGINTRCCGHLRSFFRAESGVLKLLREIILAVAQLVDLLFSLYVYVVIGRVLISWVNPDPYNPIVRFLRNATDPILNRMYRVLPLVFGGIDFTPMLLLLLLTFCQRVVKAGLLQLAYSIG